MDSNLRRPWMAIVLTGLITALLVPSSVGAAAKPDPDAFAKCQEKKNCTTAVVQGVVDKQLDGTHVKGVVIGTGKNKFSVKLTGEVEDADLKKKIEASIEALGANLSVLPTIEVTKPPIPKVTDFWFLTYLHQSAASKEGGNKKATPASSAKAGDDKSAVDNKPASDKAAAQGGQDAAADSGDAAAGTTGDLELLLGAFKKAYPGSNVELAGEDRLLLQGPRAELDQIKRQLALIDTPWPQVQLNLWAIQVSGSDRCIAERTAWIERRIRTTRDRMNEVKALLEEKARSAGLGSVRDRFESLAGTIGLDFHSKGSLSINEALIFLLLAEGDSEMEWFKSDVIRQRAQWQAADDKLYREKNQCLDLPLQMPPPSPAVFSRLAALMARDRSAHGIDFHDFLCALGQFKPGALKLPDDCGAKLFEASDAARRLNRKGTAVDRVLKNTMDAFSEDMNELLFDPLLTELRRLAIPKPNGDGITVVGQSRIVVTSALESSLDAEMASAVETTRPTPFGQNLLDKAKALAAPPAAGAAVNPIDLAVSGLSNAQTFLVASALLGEPQPTFNQIAPGISITVRPTVVPDGSAARLKLDARFSTTTTALNADNRQDVWAQAPPSAVGSHHVKTSAAVSAFDLFNISSFSVQTTAPQRPAYVPFLGRIPFLGPIFQFPRSPKVTRQESLILVNAVIVPRSVELQRFYSPDLGGKETPTGKAAGAH